MAEIAITAEKDVVRPGQINARRLAAGAGWAVDEVVCSCGPVDRPYDEQHDDVVIALVTGGTFQYRGSGSNGREMMTPGSILLGSPGQAFACGHEHSIGDRCLSFRFAPEYFATIADGTPACDRRRVFRSLRLPPIASLSPVVADACAALAAANEPAWEEIGVRVAAHVLHADAALDPDPRAITSNMISRVTRTVRMIEAHPAGDLTTIRLAREAGLSPFHFLRTFEKVTGVTPHKYILRMRLRHAATMLAAGSNRILDVALDAGFGDVSNFNHAFRGEFGVSPRRYRQRRS